MISRSYKSYRILPDFPRKEIYRQHGLSMVEVMVAMTLSLLVALAAISGLIVARQGFSSVGDSSQLRDRGRFAAELIERVVVQSGFKDRRNAALPSALVAGVAVNPDPNITGTNNAWFDAASNTTTSRVSGESGYGSDVLVIRYQSAETFPGSTVADGSIIDCAGNVVTTLPVGRYDRMVSVFHVGISKGEPTLMCSYSTTGAAPFTSQPVVQGVENFQVLFGTDAVTPGVASTATTTSGTPNAFLRADQLAVGGDATGTNNNWRRVRSVRFGIILRGTGKSAQDSAAATLYPFGVGKSGSSGSAGSAMSNSSSDPGTVFTTPTDMQLRQVVTFTVHLRNDQGL